MSDARRPGGLPDEGDAMRELARHLADVGDTPALLRFLLDTVLGQCCADGAAVSQVAGGDAVVLTSAGVGAPAHGVSLPIAGSVAERAIARREVLVERELGDVATPFGDWGRRASIGELMVAPLFAAGALVGTLEVWRLRGGPAFGDGERRRLGTIAAYAAVALHKQRLIEDAHAAALAKSNFLAAVSHELRTPLTTLAGYGELLAEGIVGALSDDQQDVVERMRSVTHQLSALIDEILTYSSLEANRERARLRRIPAIELVRSAAAAAEPLASQKGLAFGVQLTGDLPVMTTDPDMVRQILANLLGNAAKFTDAGSITLGVAVDDALVRFAVSDTGIGIDPADIPRLFQPFVQLDGGLTRRHGGTGLGLYISRRLAELLGGHLEVASAPGVGSTFTVAIPVESAV